MVFNGDLGFEWSSYHIRSPLVNGTTLYLSYMCSSYKHEKLVSVVMGVDLRKDWEKIKNGITGSLALFPGLPFFFFCLHSVQYKEVEEQRKTGRAWESLSCDVDVSERKVDIEGWCPTTNSWVKNLRMSFLCSQSHEWLGPCPAMECSRMKTSMVFECGPIVDPLPHLCPPRVHLTSFIW